MKQKQIFLSLLGIFSLFLAPLAFAHDGPELTIIQNAAGYVNGGNLIRILGILALAVGGGAIIYGLGLHLLINKTFVEFIAWVGTLTLIVLPTLSPNSITPEIAEWIVPIGSMLIPVCILFSGYLREWPENEKRFSFVLTIVWAAIAAFYLSSFVGFLAACAFMSYLGFSVFISPLCFAFGFTKEKLVAPATFAAIILSFTYGFLQAASLGIPQVQVFETGALYAGGIVTGFGILLLSSGWFKDSVSRAGNILAVIVFFGGGFVSLLFGIGALTGIYMVFGVLWAAVKVVEIETESVLAFGGKMLFAGAMLFLSWRWYQNNPDVIANMQNAVQIIGN